MFPEDPESEGQAIGFDSGCEALFDDAMVYELYWGEDSVDAWEQRTVGRLHKYTGT